MKRRGEKGKEEGEMKKRREKMKKSFYPQVEPSLV